MLWLSVVALGIFLYSRLMARFHGLPSSLVEESNDLRIYRSAGESILRGEIPYRDFFIEYPPGSFSVFVPPALFSDSPHGYQALFASEMALILVAVLALTALSARRLRGFREWPVPALAMAAGAIMLYPVAVTRYDPLVALTLSTAVFCVALGKRYRILAYLSLGLGAAAKLIPALVTFPLALLRDEREGGLKRAISGYLAFFAVIGLFFVPSYLLGKAGFAESFAYHASRGLQLESVASSVLLKLGWVREVVFDHGAFEVRGRGVNLAVSLSLPITATLLLVTALASYLQHRRGSLVPEAFPRYAAAFILAFMLGSKVLSPQYVIWLLPVLPLSFGGLAGIVISSIFLATCWATTQVFPLHYGELFDADSPGTELLLFRNGLLLVLWVLMLVPALGKNRT